MLSSKLIALIVTQAIILLNITLFFLIAYIITLRKKLASSHAEPSSAPDITGTHEQSSYSKADDTWLFGEFLSEELNMMSNTYQSLSGSDKSPEISGEQEEKITTIAIRYSLFKAEKQALEFRNDPEPFWVSLTEPLLAIASSLSSEKSLPPEEIDAQHSAELSTLNEQIKDLESSQELLFALQGQTRTLLPIHAAKELLPLTNEMDLIKSEGGLESLSDAYARCFESLNKSPQPEPIPPLDSQETSSSESQDFSQTEHIKDLETLVGRFAEESKQMLTAITFYERENNDLKTELDTLKKSDSN